MGTKSNVTFKLSSVESGFTDSGTLNPAYKTGQIIFVEDTGKIYLDFHNVRTCYSNGSASSSNTGINYVGIAQTDPSLGSFILVGGTETYVPSENDMVVFGVKEYIYRKGGDDNNTLGWYEVGDEDALTWN